MNEKLLRYLLEQQLLTAEQADELRHAQEETNKSIRELILERAILPEEQVIEALSSLTRTPVVHLYGNDHPHGCPTGGSPGYPAYIYNDALPV